MAITKIFYYFFKVLMIICPSVLFILFLIFYKSNPDLSGILFVSCLVSFLVFFGGARFFRELLDLHERVEKLEKEKFKKEQTT